MIFRLQVVAPVAGNGYIGISLDGSHGVWLKGERGLDIATDYNPIVQFDIKGYDHRGKASPTICSGEIHLSCRFLKWLGYHFSTQAAYFQQLSFMLKLKCYYTRLVERWG